MKAWYSKVRDTELKDGSVRATYVVTFETDNAELKREVEKYLQGIMDKTEPTISKMEQVDKDINVRSKDEPKTQTKTQNSNLTFKTLEYCNICDHKGCKECISNALDEHCIPSQFKKQIEDECAKEYEELGLKELKELIEADRKTEPSNSEKPNNCEDEARIITDGTYLYTYDKMLGEWRPIQDISGRKQTERSSE